jgi:hypothetical protein
MHIASKGRCMSKTFNVIAYAPLSPLRRGDLLALGAGEKELGLYKGKVKG